MEHVESLIAFISHSLSDDEISYLIGRLSPSDSSVLLNSDVLSESASVPIIESFVTSSKRTIKYLVIKKQVLIQKPKVVSKLRNLIKHIGSGDGGFSDQVVEQILNNLIQDKVLRNDQDEIVVWLS